jgi:hypothetical protein
VTGVAAIHHPLRHVDPRPGYIRSLVHIDHAANQPAVDAQAQFQLGVFDIRPRDFQRAFYRRLQARLKDQRHAIVAGNFFQPSGRFRFAKLLCAANDLIERIQQRPLSVDQNLRIANDVDEEDMCQLQLDFFVNLGRHTDSRRHRVAGDTFNSPADRRGQS